MLALSSRTVAALLVVLGVALVAAASAPRWFQLDGYTFERYERDFGKHYRSPDERAMRRDVFAQRLREIQQHNSMANGSWKKGVNHWSDRTDAERRRVNGLAKAAAHARRNVLDAALHYQLYRPASSNATLPSAVDWRSHGVVSPVKDQGHCGSCWSFASAETLESMWAIATGELSLLSQQHILSCTLNPTNCGGTGGCGGGTAELAYGSLIANNGGIASEWVYPYLSYRGQDLPCQYSIANTPNAARVAGLVRLPPNQYEPVLHSLATVGPSAIAVDANAWHDYESGVFNGCNMTSPDLNHVVQLVGYGSDPKFGDYWLVRNSWSPAWGEQGYIRIARSANPVCGTDSQPQDGSGCDGGPASITVCGECGILYDVCYPIVAANQPLR